MTNYEGLTDSSDEWLPAKFGYNPPNSVGGRRKTDGQQRTDTNYIRVVQLTGKCI